MKLSIRNFNLKEKSTLILSIAFVYGNGSFLYLDNPVIFKILFLAILCLFVLAHIKEINASNYSIALFVFILFPFLSTLLSFSSDSNIVNLISTTIYLILLGLFPGNILSSLIDGYSRFIYILALISIVMGPLYLTPLREVVYAYVPISRGPFQDGNGYYNLWVYTERVWNDFRTQSVFWEPGAWAFNQAIGFYWLVFRKKWKWPIPVFILSFIITASTTGIALCAMGIFSLFILGSYAQKRVLKKTILISVCGVTLLFSTVLSSVSGKVGQLVLDQTINKFDSKSHTYKSFTNRKESTVSAVKNMVENPFFGLGKMDANSFKEKYYVTSTILEIGYQTGFFFLLFFLLIYTWFFRKIGILSFFFAMIQLNGEPMGSSVGTLLIITFSIREIMDTHSIRNLTYTTNDLSRFQKE